MFRPGPPRDERELPRRFRFADIEVDVGATRARRGGAALPLEPKAFDLLLLLAANPGRVVEKAEIFERLWEQSFVTDNALTRVVAALRHELGDSPARPTVIETVRTRGYRFLPAIEAVEGGTPEAAGPAAAPATPFRVDRLPAATRPPWRRAWPWVAIAFAAGLLAAGAIGLGRLWRSLEPTPAGPFNLVQVTTEPGNHLYPAFSPDGSQLVYVGDAAGGLELFLMPVGGGQATRLTHSGACTEPAWSRDGRWIVYTDLARGGLWLISPNGGKGRQLTDFGAQPAWSPDARSVVFSHPGQPVLGALQWPAAYDSALWVVDVATGAARPLTRAMPGAGGQGMPAFTADGRWVVFATASFRGSNLWRVAAGGGEPEQLLSKDDVTSDQRVFWHDPTPTPHALYVIRRGPESTQIDRLGLGELARPVPLLAPAPVPATQLAVSQDGRRLAFAVQEAANSIEEVELSPDGTALGPPRTLAAPRVERVWLPAYSPDGTFLLFLRLRAGAQPDVVVVDRQGREVQVISGLPVWLPRWASPTEIVLRSVRDSVRVDVVTGLKTPVTAPPGAEQALARSEGRKLSLSPNLRQAAFSAHAGTAKELFLWEVGTAGLHQLTRLGGAVDFPSFSRDGRWVLFQFHPRPDAANELWRIAPAGGEPERILNGYGPSWAGELSTRGDLVAYAADRGGTWYLAVAGPHTPERLLAVPPETVGYLRWPTWSPDGGRIAYERAHYRSQIWTLDLEPPPAGY